MTFSIRWLLTMTICCRRACVNQQTIMDNNGFNCYFNNGLPGELEIMKYAIECLPAALKLNKNVSDLTNLVGCLPSGLKDSLREVSGLMTRFILLSCAPQPSSITFKKGPKRC